MKLTIYIDSDLTPRWRESWPERSISNVLMDVEAIRNFTEEWNQALQKAKEEAIPFSPVNDLLDAFRANGSPLLVKDSFVTIDYDGTVEVVGFDETGNSNCSDDNIVHEVARLIPSKPKEEVKADKPDFEQLLTDHILEAVNLPGADRAEHQDIFIAFWCLFDPSPSRKIILKLFDKIWSDFYLPKVESLEKEINDTRADLGRALKGLNESHLQKTNEELRSKNLTLKNKNKELQSGVDEMQKEIDDECARFDRAEKQWLNKFDEFQSRIKELEEENDTLKLGIDGMDANHIDFICLVKSLREKTILYDSIDVSQLDSDKQMEMIVLKNEILELENKVDSIVRRD